MEQFNPIRQRGEDLETRIESLRRKLPPKIAEGLEERYHATPDDLLAAFEKAIYARRKQPRSPLTPVEAEVVDEVPDAVVSMIERLQNEDYEAVGEGRSGKVIASPQKPKICYKVLFDDSRQPVGTNDIALEADLQKAAADLGERHGVRTPKVLYFIRNKSLRAIAMERLDAVSLRDVFERKAALPASFNGDRFFSALGKYVSLLNSKGTYHRDLHAGNVMIDAKTGMPYVVDFGHAVRSAGDEGVYRAEAATPHGTVTCVFPDDEKAPKSLKRELALFLGR